ncbi:MAG: hypothetical protein DMF80_22450 [Acidobacteria bacterium]|nr:MAG: hypothetical protein DMF80_22450 [Acidobacteriota bacterium]
MNRRTVGFCAKVVRPITVAVVLGWASFSPSPASAQLSGLIVTVTSPADGSTVGGTIQVSASVGPLGVLVQRVQFQLDGTDLGAADTTAPYSVPWDTKTATNASHTLRAAAQNALGLWFWSDPVTVTVFNDKTPPTVAISSPSPGATVTGTISVTASASDNVGVVGVQFKLDGAPLGGEDTAAPYSVTWNSASATPGTHTLSAAARDAAGNVGNSAPVSVTVPDTTPPTATLTSPASGATVTGTISVTATASDNVGVAGVQFQLDGAPLGAEDTTAPYSVPWNTATSTPGSHTLRAVARDAAGNTGPSSAVSVTVPDTTAPTVSITSPAPGATVTGIVAVNAAASDNVGVAGVQFQLDGAPLGAEDASAPYAVNWDTTNASPGSHSLTAVARDGAGNKTTASPVSVTVPDTMPPTVTMTSPGSGATVTGVVAVSVTATDNVGVAGVQFQLDGAPYGAEDTSAPYSVNWDTANGSHSLRAVARDAAGNNTTSAAVTVTVSNGAPPDTTPPTVTMTAPAPGATVAGSVSVTADASDNVGVAGVQFQLDGAPLGAEDTAAPYSVSWNTATAANGTHTLTAVARDAANNTATAASVTVTVSNGALASGDLFITLLDGSVQWHGPDGSLRQVLSFISDGQASSAAFDAAGNLYVPHWWGHSPGMPGNMVARYSSSASYLGAFGSGYNCDPSSVTFDHQGNMYVGQADCAGSILKFDPSGNLVATFAPTVVNRGTDHIDLGADGCTMFYTSRSKDVLRFDVCANAQLPNFNTQPLPGDQAYHIRVLPDGGVLVTDTTLIVRLDASGNQVQTYVAPGESNYIGGVDLVGDGTFWATNSYSSNVFRFDLQSGAVLASFNTGTGNYTVTGLGVKP